MSCEFGYSPDDVARALDGEPVVGLPTAASVRAHVEGCPSCTRAAGARAAAKEAWGRAKNDGAGERSALEQRLIDTVHIPRAPSSRLALATSAAAGGLAVAAAMALLAPRAVVPTPRIFAAHVLRTATAPREALRKHGVVAITSCRTCTTPVEAGDVVHEGARVEVPPGARLTLSFLVDERLVDPATNVELDGPAVVEPDAEGLLVVDGVARVHARGGSAVVASARAGVRTESEDGAWTVEVHGAVTRVAATQGEVTVDTGSARRALRAGTSVKLGAEAPRGIAARPAAEIAATRATTEEIPEEELFRRAQAALRRGDRAAAEPAFQAVIDRATSPRLRGRASFALAELELARGAREDAELRLSALLRDPAPELAEDAALLLLARAEALLDAGDADAARALVIVLRRAPSLSDVARRRVERVEARLAR